MKYRSLFSAFLKEADKLRGHDESNDKEMEHMSYVKALNGI